MNVKQKRAIQEAHFNLCFRFQGFAEHQPPVVNGVAQWRVWHLSKEAVSNMNAADLDLYKALMRLKED